MPLKPKLQHISELVTDTEAISAANATMASGATTGVFGFLLSINWLGLIGAIVAIVGLASNIYFQIRRDRREQEESQARVRAIEEGVDL